MEREGGGGLLDVCLWRRAALGHPAFGGDMYVTMWRLRGEGVLGCIVLGVEQEREKATSRLS